MTTLGALIDFCGEQPDRAEACENLVNQLQMLDRRRQ